jgi:general secretion pathway protein J
LQARANKGRRGGFTLVETLAALAVTTSIIVGAATLTHHVVFHFDHGARGVDDAERFALAMERLARDFGAASYATLKPTGAAARIAPAPGAAPGKTREEPPALVAFDGAAERLVFVTSSAVAARAAREEIVTLSVESVGEDGARLVRRRTPWLGPRGGLDDGPAQDLVVLLEGRFDISFAYGRVEQGATSWSADWRGETELPRLVRLDLRDKDTGERLFPGAEFVLRADAPAACASADSKCLPAKRRESEAPPRRTPT